MAKRTKAPAAAEPAAKTTRPRAATAAVTKTTTRRRSRAAAGPTPQAPADPAPSREREVHQLRAEPLEERADDDVEQPFAEGAHDAIDPDLRHRMISEAAYHHYVQRGYEDGYDLDDWLQAEAEIDHLLLDRAGR